MTSMRPDKTGFISKFESKLPDAVQHDFLILTYETIGFIINRNQFSASLFLDQSRPIRSNAKYIGEIIEYNDENVLVFDCDAYLQDLFEYEEKSSVHLALISDTAGFSEKNRRLFQKLTAKSNGLLSSRYLALKVGNQAGMKKIPFAELKPIPDILHGCLNREGILGCRFMDEKSIQFFIDIEDIVFHILFRKG